MYTPLTIKDVSTKYTERTELTLFGQFLDDFRNEERDKYALIKEEPLMDNCTALFLCLLAATAHKLANDNGLQIPDWVKRQQYIYDGVYYAFNTSMEDFRRHLEQTTPAEFVQRNLFLGDNVLSRV